MSGNTWTYYIKTHQKHLLSKQHLLSLWTYMTHNMYYLLLLIYLVIYFILLRMLFSMKRSSCELKEIMKRTDQVDANSCSLLYLSSLIPTVWEMGFYCLKIPSLSLNSENALSTRSMLLSEKLESEEQKTNEGVCRIYHLQTSVFNLFFPFDLCASDASVFNMQVSLQIASHHQLKLFVNGLWPFLFMSNVSRLWMVL